MRSSIKPKEEKEHLHQAGMSCDLSGQGEGYKPHMTKVRWVSL